MFFKNQKYLGYLLLGMLILPICIVFAWIQIHKYNTKKDIQREMISSKLSSGLVSFTFSKKDSEEILYWEHDGEFEFKNEMYDVISSTAFKDSITYLCWPDNDESFLNKKLSELITQKLNTDDQHQNNKQQLISFYKSLYCSHQNTLVFYVEKCGIVYPVVSELISQIFPVNTPPPIV